ncbi:hypothetical protein NC651_000852 [Populus alba x Populus x berolinensis]|nr:hypothetical protein NC651_000852 [Populus alba x Populus x berolinensis]
MKGKRKAPNTRVLRVKSHGPGIQSCSGGSLDFSSFLIPVSQDSPASLQLTTLAATLSLSVKLHESP